MVIIFVNQAKKGFLLNEGSALLCLILFNECLLFHTRPFYQRQKAKTLLPTLGKGPVLI
jgi:hypothetical protein